MYFFVRFQAFVTMVMGVMLMIFGVVVAVFGFIQNAAVVDMINNFLIVGSGIFLQDARFYTSVLGMVCFMGGIAMAACGQLLLVFVDMANSARDANAILHNMNKKG